MTDADEVGSGGGRERQELVEGRDYYVEESEEGWCVWVFTEEFLRRRGWCCGSGCRHCPYGEAGSGKRGGGG